jgi:hypothetical protein
MFVLKSSHTAEVKRLCFEIESLKHAYDQYVAYAESRIEDLKAQREDFRKLIFVPAKEPSPEIYEADAIISNSEKPVEMSEQERTAYLEGNAELDRLLSGNYDQESVE